ncbi:MAG: response regulator [Alphaproteobacteria bacterium]
MADRSEQLKARLLKTFRTEAADHIRAIETDMEALMNDPAAPDTAARLESLFRTMHTLKGAARSVGLKAVESLCQDSESDLRRLTRGETQFTAEALNSLRQGVVAIVARLASLEAPESGTGRPSPPPAAPEPVPVRREIAQDAVEMREPIEAVARPAGRDMAPAGLRAGTDTIRVELTRIDNLILGAEALLAPKLSLAERIGGFKQLIEGLGRLRVTAGAEQGFGDGRRTEYGASLAALEQQARDLLRGFEGDHRLVRNAADDLFDQLRRVRMLPAASIVEAFPTMVRDVAEQVGKSVIWNAVGTGLEIDRKVLEYIKDPLIHLVRNAIDHGIEPPQMRRDAGKRPEGSVRLSFERLESGRIAIRIEDDGRGIDFAKVKESAVRLRLVSRSQAAGISDADAQDLLFRSGLSTSAVVTTLSGHGLGLSVVRERVERLGGQINVTSTPGLGTAVTLVIPESIATFQGVLLSAGGRKFLCPREAVLSAIRIAPDVLELAARRRLLSWDGGTIPFASLADVLDLGTADEQDLPRQCVVIAHGGTSSAFAVHEVVGDAEALVKEFRWPIVRLRNFSAVGLLGSGDLSLILRPSDLLRSTRRSPRRPGPRKTERRRLRRFRVLVVDDSITTRTMERHLFEAAGFSVKVAADGIDAWTLLNSEDVDIVVSDIDMPRLDGFDLTARIRADARLRELPIVLVTALETREDKEKGLRLGANAYVQKSTFDQSNLLDIVRRLI